MNRAQITLLALFYMVDQDSLVHCLLVSLLFSVKLLTWINFLLDSPNYSYPVLGLWVYSISLVPTLFGLPKGSGLAHFLFWPPVMFSISIRLRGDPFMTSTKKNWVFDPPPPVHMSPHGPDTPPPCGRPHAVDMKYTPLS